jgi:hypothetical protein
MTARPKTAPGRQTELNHTMFFTYDRAQRTPEYEYIIIVIVLAVIINKEKFKFSS